MLRFAAGFDLEQRGQCLPVFTLCCILFFFGFVVAAAFPQSAPAAVVAKVEVWVDGTPNTENLERLVSIPPGDPYSLSTIRASIKQIHKSRLFSDVVVVRSGGGGVDLRCPLPRG